MEWYEHTVVAWTIFVISVIIGFTKAFTKEDKDE